MRFPFRIALYVFHLIPIIGPMGGWVGPEGLCWEFAPSGAAAAEPSKWGTSYWLPSAPARAAAGGKLTRERRRRAAKFNLEWSIFEAWRKGPSARHYYF